jgi:16S rRNA processing protein RimM
VTDIEVIVGTLGRAHGLHGEIYVDLRTDSPKQRFAIGAQVWPDGGDPLTIKSFRLQGARGVVRFAEVGERTEAEKLVGSRLVSRVDSTEVPADESEYYDHQLMGLDVVTSEGEWAGKVSRVEHLGFQDSLVVETSNGERFIPFVNDLVPEVDLEAGCVIIRAIPGLLEDQP